MRKSFQSVQITRCRRVGKRWKVDLRKVIKYILALKPDCDMKIEMKKKACTKVMEKITM